MSYRLSPPSSYSPELPDDPPPCASKLFLLVDVPNGSTGAADLSPIPALALELGVCPLDPRARGGGRESSEEAAAVRSTEGMGDDGETNVGVMCDACEREEGLDVGAWTEEEEE